MFMLIIYWIFLFGTPLGGVLVFCCYQMKGDEFMNIDAETAAEAARRIAAEWKGKKGGVIPILQGIQHEFGYLPEAAMEAVSAETKVPLAELYGVATFYAQFHLSPRGKHIVRVCRGTACHVRGSLGIFNKIKNDMGLTDEKLTTDDFRFTVEPVACIGACGLAPVLMVDDETHGRLTLENVSGILSKYE